MTKKPWKSMTLCATLLSTLLLPAAHAQTTSEYKLESQDMPVQLALDRRSGESLRELKTDPAKALILSLLYPGLGHFYIGNDNERSTWIMISGTAIIVGSLIGWNLLKDRNQGTLANDTKSETGEQGVKMGDILISTVFVGFHLWNVRDAYLQADQYNRKLEKEHLISALKHIKVAYKADTLTLSYKLSF